MQQPEIDVKKSIQHQTRFFKELSELLNKYSVSICSSTHLTPNDSQVYYQFETDPFLTQTNRADLTVHQGFVTEMENALEFYLTENKSENIFRPH